jgi:hypothetical protein
MTLGSSIALFALSAAVFAPAQAAVQYTFKGFTSESAVGPSPVSFSLIVADFITTDTFFEAGSLDGCSNPTSSCQGVKFNIDGVEYDSPPDYLTAGLQVIEFGTENGTFFHYFASTPDLPFSTPGTYGIVFDFHPATLTVAVVSEVPEPRLMAPLLAGLGVMVPVVRRYRAD